MKGKRYVLVGDRAFLRHVDGSISYGCAVNKEIKEGTANLDCCGSGKTSVFYDKEKGIWRFQNNSDVRDLDDYNANRLSEFFWFDERLPAKAIQLIGGPRQLTKLSMRKHG